MTDDLKERLLTWYPGQDEESLREEAVARITDLESRLAAANEAASHLFMENVGLISRLAAAEAGEDALAAGLRALWFHDAPHSALAAYEARRKG